MIYLQLFWTYIQIGLFGFGGGYAMLSLIQDEVVNRHGWISAQEFTEIIAVSQVTPGPIGINSATYIGYTVTGNVWGALIATFAVSLPSFLLVLLISFSFRKFRRNQWVNAAFTGIRPASVGLIAAAALLLMLQPSLITLLFTGTLPTSADQIVVSENFPDYKSLIIFILALICTIKKWVHPILLVLLAALCGLLFY